MQQGNKPYMQRLTISKSPRITVNISKMITVKNGYPVKNIKNNHKTSVTI